METEKKITQTTDNSLKRMGIFGGTFDPIHYGHLMIAENAREQYSLDQVLFIPTGHSPLKHKQQITDSVHRCMMVSKAIADHMQFALHRIEVHSQEISYTFRTIEMLKENYKNTELFFILGADSLFDFESWRNPELIVKNCSILAAYREHKRQEEFFLHLSYLNEKYPGKFYPLDTPSLDVSSHEIRNRVQDQKTIRYLVPKVVEDYIWEHKLYKSDTTQHSGRP